MNRSPTPDTGAPPVTSETRAAQRFSRALRRLVREPLLHFLLIGIALFALYSHFQRGRGGGESSEQIHLTLDDLRYLDSLFQAQWHRPPTPDDLQRLVEDRIQEEILYREGIAMGLDKGDTIVKRRMAQKLQFLAEDVAAAREPSTEELKAWYAKNSAKFAMPKRVSFRHLYLSPDRRGTNARPDAAKLLAQLAGQPEAVKLPESSADPFMFQEYYRDRATDYLGKEFGPQFALAVEKLPTGSWRGPVESGFGWHLVFVDTAIPGRVPDFEEIEPDVKLAWLAEQKVLAWDKAYQKMRAKYTVSLPRVPESASSAPAPTTKTAAAVLSSSSKGVQ
jgi:peptidyl-prolyl cis-trans isomerase C